MSERPRLGFVGVGAIVEALITGMCAAGEQRANFLLSPRNAQVARRLAERFSAVTVAADNQAVLAGSDVIFLAVRPQVAADVLGTLKFRADHHIVSLIATFDVARLRPLVAPASAVSRVAPIPAVARRMGPLLLHPPMPEIARLLQGLGHLIQLENESDLDAFWSTTGLMSSYFGLLGEMAGWLSRQNLEETQVRIFVASLFEALGTTASERAGAGFDQLIAQHTTAGGLNEQAWRELRAAGWPRLFSEALDLIHARVLGKAAFADRLPGNREST